MGDKSRIDWTDATLNFAYGCQQVSEACQNCYAIGTVKRLSLMGHADLAPALHYDPSYLATTGPAAWSGKIVLKPERMEQALRWKKPRRIFVNSLSDTFHESIPDDVIGRWWDVMARASQHTFQILTKRPERAAQLVPTFAERHTSKDGSTWPLKNVWVGTTVENQDAFTARVEHLLAVPAAVHFLSMEPLLGPVNLRKNVRPHRDGRPLWPCSEHALDFIDWVICGGESGPNARPMNPEWVRDLRDQCQATGTPFFFKQWGEWGPREGGYTSWPVEDAGKMTGPWTCVDSTNRKARGEVTYHLNPTEGSVHEPVLPGGRRQMAGKIMEMAKVGKRNAGHLLDGVEHHAWPEGVTR